MSADPSYIPPVPPAAPAPMVHTHTHGGSGHSSIHLALGLLALAFAIFLFSQIRSVAKQNEILQWQITNSETQNKSLVDGEKQLTDLATQRESLVKQSAEIQSKYQSLLNDVLELAKDDKDAKEVVEAWKIQRAGSGNAEAAPAAKP